MNEYDYLAKASKEMEEAQFSEVISLCDKALKINSKLPDAYSFRGNAKYELEQYDSALMDFSNLIELEPEKAIHYYDRSWTYANLDSYEDAILDMDKAIELEPDTAEFYIDKGKFEYDAQRYKEAIRDFTKGIKLKQSFLGYVYRGNAYFSLDVYDLALSDYNQAIELDSAAHYAYFRRGVLKRKMEKLEDAFEDLKKALELCPRNASILLEIGLIKIELNQKDAMDYYDMAIKACPRSENYIAKFNARQRIYEKKYAIKTLSTGKFLEDNKTPYFIYDTKQAKEDIKDLDKIITLTPDDFIAHEKRAERYTYLGKYKKAILDYDFLISFDPENSEYYSKRAFCYEKIWLHKEAISDCKKSVELNNW